MEIPVWVPRGASSACASLPANEGLEPSPVPAGDSGTPGGGLGWAELERHVSTIATQNVNTVRYELLKALLNNTQDTFVDPLHGSLGIEPLANGDSVTYPPVIASESEATEDHYLESGYAASAISDSNNPYVTIRDDLAHHFGISGDGYNFVVFTEQDQRGNLDVLELVFEAGFFGYQRCSDGQLGLVGPRQDGVLDAVV